MGEFPGKTLKANDARSKEIQQKGARTPSLNKKIAARIRMMKKHHKWTAKDEDWFIECFQNPEANIAKMLEKLEEFFASGKIKEADYMNFLERIHKLQHGDKKTVTHEGDIPQINFQLNMFDENED